MSGYLYGIWRDCVTVTAAWLGLASFTVVSLALGDPAFDASRTEYDVAPSTCGVEIGDLNGDGRPDLVVASYRTGENLSVLLNLGSGKFGSATKYSSGGYPFDVAIADFNNDGRPDLAAPDGSAMSGGHIFLNQGKGVFLLYTNLPTSAKFEDVASGDFNKDGKADLAFPNYNGPSVSVCLGNGDGSFQSFTDYTTCPTDSKAFLVEVEDLDNDSNLDLIVLGNSKVNTLYGAGDGTFGTASNWSLPSASYSMTRVGDLDGDGNKDLITSAANSLAIHWGKGGRDYEASSSLATTMNPITSLALADMDGDGDLDIVLGDGSYYVGVIGNLGSRSFTGTVKCKSGDYVYDVALADLDGDSNIDVAAACYVSEVVAVHNGSTNGLLSVYPGITEHIYYPEGMVFEDFNGDSFDDVVVGNMNNSNDRLSVYLSNGDGTFTNRAWYSGQTYGNQALAAADFNEDGKLDVAVAHNDTALGLYLGNGNGTFNAESYWGKLPSSGSDPRDIEVADFNNDNHQDVAIPDSANGIAVYLGAGDGTFGSGIKVTMDTTPLGVAVGDFDGDGDDDLAAAHGGGAYGIWVRLSNGDGTFADATTYALPGAPYTYGKQLHAADLNKDGKLDLVACSSRRYNDPGFNQVSVLLGNGNGTFAPRVDYSMGQVTYVMDIGDVDGDGNLDIVTANYTSYSASLLRGAGDGTFTRGGSYGSRYTSSCLGVALGDADNNGRLEVALASFDRLEVFSDWAAPVAKRTGTVIVVR